MLIADSGSSKTDWILSSQKNGILEIHTQGINPVRDSKDAIVRILQEELMPQLPQNYEVGEVHFFGAGCIAPFKEKVFETLQITFPRADIEVESDLLGAAIALCGDQPGVACILGTGSNSCLYDGQRIVNNVSPLGYILGDEGSGAVMGKLLVGNLLKEVFPRRLKDAFLAHFQLTPTDIIDHVYRQPLPNRFLASLVPFIVEHRSEPVLRTMVIDSLRQFFVRNVRNYNSPQLPVHFVGGIASEFQSELTEAAKLEGFIVGRILKRPAPEIANFYRIRQKEG